MESNIKFAYQNIFPNIINYYTTDPSRDDYSNAGIGVYGVLAAIYASLFF
jgi:hypothetical protein